jgi:hypothetical protein
MGKWLDVSLLVLTKDQSAFGDFVFFGGIGLLVRGDSWRTY